MPKPANLIGKIFGRLEVIESAGSDKFGHRIWLCKCECGNTVINPTGRLNFGDALSCGCYQADVFRSKTFKHGHSGINKSVEYSTWLNMTGRCGKNHKNKDRYSKRGIYVCDRWKNSFESFLEDMGSRPSSKHSIDRINNDLGYYKENCRWATSSEQARNTSRNHWIEHNGERMILSDWAVKFKVRNGGGDILHYLKLGKSFEWIYNYYTTRNLKNTIQ